MLGAVKLDTATCIYKCSLYTVWGYIYKLGKFVMANCDVAGIYSDIYIYGINSGIVYIVYIHIFRNISDTHSAIYIQLYICTEIFREFMRIQKYICAHIHQKYSDIYSLMHIKHSRHTKCAAGMLILVIIDMRDMVALFSQYRAYCTYTAFQMLSKYFRKLGNRITYP